jgi:hypothetical protein
MEGNTGFLLRFSIQASTEDTDENYKDFSVQSGGDFTADFPNMKWSYLPEQDCWWKIILNLYV